MTPTHPAPANSNTDTDVEGRWLLCTCGYGYYVVKLDESTGFNHVICDHCGADCTMRIFGQ